MSISTKRGDEGTTGLWSGERVRKDDLRVEAYGTIDELNSILGECRHFCTLPGSVELLEKIQLDLIRVCGELATASGEARKTMAPCDSEALTAEVNRYEEDIKLSGFVIPGSTLSSAKLDVARTVCRRAERRIVTLADSVSVGAPLRQYMNRLSDLLFMMARAEEKAEGKLRYSRPKQETKMESASTLPKC